MDGHEIIMVGLCGLLGFGHAWSLLALHAEFMVSAMLGLHMLLMVTGM
jgi:hypothetical protein